MQLLDHSIDKVTKQIHHGTTLLQFHTSKPGIQLNCSPKCHSEFVGEGIEYAWALAKLVYRRSVIEQKRTKDKFRQLVH